MTMAMPRQPPARYCQIGAARHSADWPHIRISASARTALTDRDIKAATIGAFRAPPSSALIGPCRARRKPAKTAAPIQTAPPIALRPRHIRLDAHGRDPIRIAHGLAAFELVDVLHALDDLAPHRVLAVEE